MTLRALLLLCTLLCLALPGKASSPLRRQLQAIAAEADAQVGVAVIIDGKDTLTVGNADRYPLMSVMKFHQALAVAHWLNKRGLPLSTPIRVEKHDLPAGTYSPLRDRHPEGGIALPISDLLAYTLQLSDNNACDILFKYIGGVAVADRFIRSLGLGGFALAATEADMHLRPETCYDNWGTPLSVATLMDRLATGALPIDTAYTGFIRRTLLACQTGQRRLPAPLQGTSARIGHKTGTSDQDAQGRWTGINDAGFVFLPDGRRYAIAVLVKHSKLSMQDTEKIIADLSAAVYRHLAH